LPTNESITTQDEAELLRAKFKNFAQQATLSYVNVIACAAVVCYIMWGQAPGWLSIGAPVALICGSFGRIIYLKRLDIDALTFPEIKRQTRQVFFASAGLSIICASGCALLLVYGDIVLNRQIVFVLIVGAQGVIVSFMHLRPSALAVSYILTPSVCLFIFLSGEPNSGILSILYLSSAVTVGMMIRQHTGIFSSLVETGLRAQRLSEENEQIANQDSLTRLPNRRMFFAHLEAAAQAGAEPFAIALLDLDGFKPVNDLYGHAVGDMLLRKASERLSVFANEKTLVARLGGDEFAIIRHGSACDINEMLNAVRNAIRAPYQIGAIAIHVATSVGYSVFPEDADNAADLYENADFALYQAKERRDGAPVPYTADLRAAKLSNVLISQRLRGADFDEEFFLQFQPIIDFDTGDPLAFEALARWRPQGLGPVAPDVFIAAAERTGQIVKLTRCLMRKALAEAALWPSSVRLSFNLSIHDLASKETTDALIEIIAQSGVDPQRIDLEITETALAKNFDRARQSILALKATGARIAMDDFGSGYSSLSYIQRLPFDEIKIDRAFAQALMRDADAKAAQILRTMIDLCRNLNLHCVTEGVETIDQARMLREFGCTAMQGYYFSRPMEAEAARALANGERLDVDARVA
jgi:diguanylate cyclase (GGDEF)-like protein